MAAPSTEPVPGQTFGMPSSPQVPIAQAPQSMAPAQPSPIIPQYWPPVAGMQLTGTQSGDGPHRFAMPPPPHSPPLPQTPQSSVPHVGRKYRP